MTATLAREVLNERLIVLPSGESGEYEETTGRLREMGGRLLQVYSPRVLIAEVPERAQPQLDKLLEEMHERLSLAGAPMRALGAAEMLGVEAHQVRQSAEFVASKVNRVGVERSWGAAPPDLSPDEIREALLVGEAPAVFAAPPPDMSPYLIGSVAVGLILVEGPTDPLKFSNAERTKIVAEVQDGLSWLALQEPLARITWVYDIQNVSIDVPLSTTLPNNFEAKEGHWRNPAMATLGFAPNLQGVVDYVASIKSAFGSDHAYVAYFTKYPLHHFAYASKPRLVMHYQNDGWGPDNIAEVFTHETGHIFGCPDEYTESRCDCTSRFGHLREVNGNCESCSPNPVPCLMARNVRRLCSFTRVHLGWRDSDRDGVLDPLGSVPVTDSR